MIRGSEKKKIKRAPLKEGQRPTVFDINQTFHSMAYKTDKLQKSIKKKRMKKRTAVANSGQEEILYRLFSNKTSSCHYQLLFRLQS